MTAGEQAYVRARALVVCRCRAVGLALSGRDFVAPSTMDCGCCTGFGSHPVDWSIADGEIGRRPPGRHGPPSARQAISRWRAKLRSLRTLSGEGTIAECRGSVAPSSCSCRSTRNPRSRRSLLLADRYLKTTASCRVVETAALARLSEKRHNR